MCGIFGCISNCNVFPFIIDGLKKLEYRGYDSTGVAILNPLGDIQIKRFIGAPSEQKWPEFFGYAGIGHTRWATHGGVEEKNSHPHLDCKGEVAVVHNGTLNNFNELKRQLENEGHQFNSTTDTEVISHLIEKYLQNLPFEEAVRQALLNIEGSYAIAAISIKELHKIVAARNVNPLVLGIDSENMYISSDIPTLSNFTSRAIPLCRNDIAVLSNHDYKIYNIITGEPVSREQITINSGWIDTERNGYSTYTEKEIFEQPDRLIDCLTITNDELYPLVEEIIKAHRLYLCGAGTSYHAALFFSYLLQNTGIQAEAIVASEFPYKAIIDSNTTTLFISQSGSTRDTNKAIEYNMENNGRSIGIVNVIGSDMERMVSHVAYTRSGPEIGVASTKNFLNQLYLLQKIWLEILKRKDLSIDNLEIEFLKLPEYVKEILNFYASNNEIWDRIVDKVTKYNPIFIGSGINYPIALESALKLKELSYLNANAYPSGELKHGPLALIEIGTPVIAINPCGHNTFNLTKTNIEEAKARGAYVIIISNSNERYDEIFSIQNIPYQLSPILTVIPGQLLALKVSQYLGRNIDKPRNLAKSVTVE